MRPSELPVYKKDPDPMMDTFGFPQKKKSPLKAEISTLSFEQQPRDQGLSVFRATNRNEMIDFIQRETTNNIDLLKGLSIDRDLSEFQSHPPIPEMKERKKWESKEYPTIKRETMKTSFNPMDNQTELDMR
jgi:hypothetical protein